MYCVVLVFIVLVLVLVFFVFVFVLVFLLLLLFLFLLISLFTKRRPTCVCVCVCVVVNNDLSFPDYLLRKSALLGPSTSKLPSSNLLYGFKLSKLKHPLEKFVLLLLLLLHGNSLVC